MLIHIYQFIDAYFWWLAGAVTYYFVVQPFLLAMLRQNAFALQTDLMYLVIRNKNADNELHQELGDAINNFIAGQKYLTFFGFFQAIGEIKNGLQQKADETEAKLQKCDKAQEETLRKMYIRVTKIVAMTVFVNSPIISFVFAILLSLIYIVTMGNHKAINVQEAKDNVIVFVTKNKNFNHLPKAA